MSMPRSKARLLTGAALALTLSAGMAASAAAQEPLVIQWLSDNIAEEAIEPVWRAMIAEFEAEHPNIKIEPLLSTQQSTWTRFVSAAQSGEAPCVIEFKDVISAAYAGYLAPIGDIIAEHDPGVLSVYPQGLLDGLTWEGKLYGLPHWGGVYADIYNLSMVKAAGLDPEHPPATMEEYGQWMKALTTGEVRGTSIMAGRTDATTRALFSWIYANGGKAFDDGMTEATFASNARAMEAINTYLDLDSDLHVIAEGATTTNYIEQVRLFSSGKIASMRQPYWALPQTYVDNPDMRGNIMVATPPLAEDGKTVVVVVSNAISNDCQAPAEAWEFVKYMNQPKWAMERQKKASWMPLREDVLDDPYFKEDPLAAAFMGMTKKGIVYPLPHPAWNDIAENDVVAAMQEALLDPESRTQVFETLDENVTNKLADY
jgi:multiple sugar transport system substrate-binding protein